MAQQNQNKNDNNNNNNNTTGSYTISNADLIGGNNVMLNRQVFDKAKFLETVDTSFSQLVDRSDLQFFDLNLATVEDFFNLYNKLFFEIPKEGEVNSHEFLAKESGEYVEFLKNNEEVQALLDEIAELRQENLNLVNEMAGIASGTKAMREAREEAQRAIDEGEDAINNS